MIDPSCDTSAGIARAHLFRWQTTVAVRYTAFSLGTVSKTMLSKALEFKKDASCIDNWAAFSFDEPQAGNDLARQVQFIASLFDLAA